MLKEFVRSDDSATIWINPDHVELVGPSEQGKGTTYIRFRSGAVVVDGNAEGVVRYLAGENEIPL